MKYLKTLGFIVGFWLSFWVIAWIGDFVSGLILPALNMNTLLGQIIILLVYITINGTGFFYGTFALSTLISDKITGIICLIWVLILNAFQLAHITIWLTWILFFVDLAATSIPVIVTICVRSSKETISRIPPQIIESEEIPTYLAKCQKCGYNFPVGSEKNFCPRCGYKTSTPSRLKKSKHFS